MGSIFTMVILLFLFLGISYLFYYKSRFTSVESMALAAVFIVFVQFLFHYGNAIKIGTFFLYGIGCLGIGLACFAACIKKARLKEFFSPAAFLICGAYLLNLFLYHGVLLHHFDDLIQWGSAVKWMYVNDSFPTAATFTGSMVHPFSTSLFNLFFARGTQMLESSLYVASALFISIGFLLPFSYYQWKDKGRVFLYGALVFVSLYAFYYYPYLNLYVDIPLIAWVTGLCGIWLVVRKLDRPILIQDLIFTVVLLCFFPTLKWGVGLLFSAIVLLFLLTFEISRSRFATQKFQQLLRSRKLWLLIGGGVILLGGIIALLNALTSGKILDQLPGAKNFFTTLVDLVTFSGDKVRLTIPAALSALTGKPLGRGTFPFSYLSALLLLLLVAYCFCVGKKDRVYRRLWNLYAAGSAVYFFLIVFIYISVFTYQESTQVASIARYFSLYILFGWTLLLIMLLSANYQKSVRKKQLLFVVCLVTLLSINQNFIKYATGFDCHSIAHYDEVVTVSEKSKKLALTLDKETAAEDVRVLMVAQDCSDLLVDRARYDLGTIINPKLQTKVDDTVSPTFCFTGGSNKNGFRSLDRKVEQLPAVLAAGDYNYLWIYKTNAYFTKGMAKLDPTATIKSGQLYRVHCGTTLTLELIDII